MSISITHPKVIKEILIGISLCIIIFGVVSIYPFLGMFALLFLPLPVLFYRLKLGRNGGGAIVAASFVVLMIMSSGFAFDILYFGSLLITGLFLGECIERHFDIQKTMGFTALMVVGAAFAGFALYAMTQGQGMGELVSDYMTRYFAVTSEIYSDMGVDENQIQALNSAFVLMLPSMFMVSYLSTIWINILIIRRLLARKGITLKSIEHLNRYRAPEFLVWVVIGLGISLMLPVQAVKLISINGLIVLMLVYFFQGIAVVSYLFEKKNLPRTLRICCYRLIAVQIYFLFIVIGLGFFDNWVNFRKLDTAK